MIATDEILARTLSSFEFEEIEDDVFCGHPGEGGRQLFGGLVAAQSVCAAARTVGEGRKLHSLHAYFLRPGAPAVAIDFAVDRVRDGGSFSTRTVTARQQGQVILTMMTSFARDEEGMAQQSIAMAEVPQPSGLPEREQLRAQRYREVLGLDLRPFESAVEVRLCDPSVIEPGVAREPRQDNWMRVRGELGRDQLAQRAMLVYASDRTLLATARMPYDLGRHQLISVSLDHAVWIHRDVDLSEWHLCECRCPVSAGGRASLLSHIYRQDGVCVATVAQEGLVRVRRSET